MNMRRIALPTALTGAVVIAACTNFLTTERTQETTAFRPVVCGGLPDWCLVARSELDGNRPGYVYVDGKERGLVLPGKTARISLVAGQAHLVNFCAYFDVAERKEWKCSTATSTGVVNGDPTLVLRPLE
jgi:NAD kinase